MKKTSVNLGFVICMGIAVILMTIACLVFALYESSGDGESVSNLGAVSGTFAAGCALFVVFSIAHGVFPYNVRGRALISIVLFVLAYKMIMMMVIGVTGALVAFFTTPMLDEAVSVVSGTMREGCKFVVLAKRLIKLDNLQFDGYFKSAYVILLLGFLRCLWGLVRSFGWGFVFCSMLAVVGSILMAVFWARLGAFGYRRGAVVVVAVFVAVGLLFVIKNWSSTELLVGDDGFRKRYLAHD